MCVKMKVYFMMLNTNGILVSAHIFHVFYKLVSSELIFSLDSQIGIVAT